MSIPPPRPKPKPGDRPKDIEEFLGDPSFVRVLVGGRGSGKTRGVAEEVTRHLWQNAGGKVIIARQTETSQDSSTIDTFWQFFETLGEVYSNTGPGLFRAWNNGRIFRVPSKLAVEKFQEAAPRLTTRAEIAYWLKTEGDRLCGRIEMRGLPDADKGKFRGMECSMLVLIEADQIVKKQFDLSLACLRWKGADPETCDDLGFIRDRNVILDTNPPSESHWIAELEKEQAKLPEAERTCRFWHLSTYDNEHNLPEHYIRDTILLPYANNPAMIERMLWGRYADAFDGKPVYYAYQAGSHEQENLPWPLGPKGTYLVRGWDVGTHNACTFSAYWTEQQVNPKTGHKEPVEFWWDLAEVYLESSDTDIQCKAVKELTEEQFPFWNDREKCAGILDYCDPAAANDSFTKKIVVNGKEVKQSALNIMRSHGIYPAYSTTARGLMETNTIVNRLLVKRDFEGRLVYQIDPKGCPRLVRAMRGGYRYPALGEPGYGSNEPLKGELCEGLDHNADSARYAKCNALKLLKTEAEPIKPSNLAARVKRNPNPARRI